MAKLITSIFVVALMACDKPSSPPVPAELKQTITSANEAFVRATRHLDKEELKAHFAGPDLQGLLDSIDRAKQHGTYAVSELQKMEWGRAEISGTKARVETTETWQHTHYRISDQQCAFRVPARSVKQVYHLENTGGKWRITNVIDDPNNRPAQAVRCR